MNDLVKGSGQVDDALDRFGEAKEGARRFHRDAVGKGVDPDHCLADFLLCVKADNRRRLEGVYKTALATTSGTAGGYLVPTEFREDILADVSGESIFRSRAVVVPMKSLTLQLPVIDATTAPAASGIAPFWGGLQFGWGPDAATLTESEPKFRELTLTAHLLGGYAKASNPLMQDSPGLESWLRLLFARSLAWYEDWSFINGTGAGQPVGVVTAAAPQGCGLTVSRHTTGHFSVQDAQTMFGDLYNVGPPVWLMTRAAGGDLTSFTGWIPNGPMVLHGIPIIVSMKQPAAGNTGDVCLIDPSLYVIGDRGEMAVDYSPHPFFTNNQSAWRITERVDGQPMLNAAVTIPDGGTTTVSPIVLLK